MSDDELDPVGRPEYLAAIEQLKQRNIVPSRGFLDLFGSTETGELILVPNSFTKGYQHSFLPPNQRPYIALDILGVFGQLSDRTWIFLPSYNRGIAYGNERQNNLRFAVLVEGERRLFQELQAQRQKQVDLTEQLREAQERIKKLEMRPPNDQP